MMEWRYKSESKNVNPWLEKSKKKVSFVAHQCAICIMCTGDDSNSTGEHVCVCVWVWRGIFDCHFISSMSFECCVFSSFAFAVFFCLSSLSSPSNVVTVLIQPSFSSSFGWHSSNEWMSELAERLKGEWACGATSKGDKQQRERVIKHVHIWNTYVACVMFGFFFLFSCAVSLTYVSYFK